MPTAPRLSIKDQTARLREDAILVAVNALLAEKGFDLMTVDEVASYVGMSKASLYKHFPSKDALAAAALVRLLDETLAVIAAQPPAAAPLAKLRAVLRWALGLRIAGRMPLLPSTRSSLREALAHDKRYMDRLMEVSDKMGAWIDEAQRKRAVEPGLPSEFVLYTVFARTCDPVLDFMRLSGQHTDDEVIELMLRACFDGLCTRA
jgi:AcrR family transcriptional regulator